MKHCIAIIVCIFSYCSLFAQGENLFNDNNLHEFRFEMVDTNIFIQSKDYQMVNMYVDGVFIDSIGFKKKGNISASHINHKFPFKVKTNKYVSGKEYDDIKEFTLHNSFQDPSLMREKMTYDLMRDLGLHGLRTAFAKVYINDLYWGLYTLVEGKDEMYKHVFDNRDGAVLESTDFGNMCYQGPNQSDYYDSLFDDYTYTLDNGDEQTAWQHFPAMLNAANNTTASEYMSTVPNFLNITDFFRYQAANVYLLNSDSYIAFRGNQLYYYNETDGIWEVIPWDFNASFGLWNTNNYTPTDYPILPNAISNGCIASKLNDVPALNDIYMGTMCDLVHNLADTSRLIGLIDQWTNQIQEAVYLDWRKDLSNSRFDQATAYGYFSHVGESVPAMKTFVIDRWEFIEQELNALNINCSTITSTQDLVSAAELAIYPNPTHNQLQLKTDGTHPIQQIALYHINGQLLATKAVEEQTAVQLDLSAYQSGFYMLKIYFSNQQSITQKVVKL